jgi:hypothetical protein
LFERNTPCLRHSDEACPTKEDSATREQEDTTRRKPVVDLFLIHYLTSSLINQFIYQLSMAETLDIVIVTPNKIILKSKALAVSSVSSLGPFDILPRHANLIALVQNTPIKILLEDKKQLEYIFPMAIIYNLKNVVKIYTDILAQPDIKLN